jgi:hypothetical protein
MTKGEGSALEARRAGSSGLDSPGAGPDRPRDHQRGAPRIEPQWGVAREL